MAIMKKKFIKNMFSIELKLNIKKLKNLIFIPLASLSVLLPIVSCSRTQEKEETISKLIIKKYNIDKLNKINENSNKEIDDWNNELNKMKLNTVFAIDFQKIGYWPWEFDKQSKELLFSSRYEKDYKSIYNEFYKKFIKDAKLITTIDLIKVSLPIKAIKKHGFWTKEYDTNLNSKEYESIIDKKILANDEFKNSDWLNIPNWVKNESNNKTTYINYFTGNYIDRFEFSSNALITKNEWNNISVFHLPPNSGNNDGVYFYQPEIFNKIQNTNPELKINLLLISKENIKKHINEYVSLPYGNSSNIQEKNILIIDLEYKHTSFYDHRLITDLNYITPLFNKNTLYLVKDVGIHNRKDIDTYSFVENKIINGVKNSWGRRINITNLDDIKPIQEIKHQAIGLYLSDDEFKNFKLNGIEFLNLDFKKELLKGKEIIKPKYIPKEWNESTFRPTTKPAGFPSFNKKNIKRAFKMLFFNFFKNLHCNFKIFNNKLI
ncbi:hypothetical protein GE118_01170 [Mycoplasma sp. NEAQ87857]|uniref:hypothetical protein n=1 Tax=Mycoplasma sp. NEAQ87857 TaxID=2683967 RepID=UPI001316AF04|nr:hypothetical protein [Mycoplasma sp. NEAQ87857]QGZ97404.1 hypothetical protein GE118_01170 [Mycoplasma sp. NEAQ87857]